MSGQGGTIVWPLNKQHNTGVLEITLMLFGYQSFGSNLRTLGLTKETWWSFNGEGTNVVMVLEQKILNGQNVLA